MTDPRPERRFQFSRRKLLLWTVVMAVWCGFWIWLDASVGEHPYVSPLGFAFFTSWFVVAIVARLTWDMKRAAIASAGWLLIASTVLGIFAPPASAPVTPDVLLFGTVFLCAITFFMFGLPILAFVEGAVRWVNWSDNLLETMTRRRGQSVNADWPSQPAAAPNRGLKLLLVSLVPVAAFWLFMLFMLFPRETLVSLSPDLSHRIIVREGLTFVDRNFDVVLVDQQTGTERKIFISDDQVTIHQERFVWSDDSSKVVLVGNPYYVKPGGELPGGDIVFLMYDVQNDKLWCNTKNDLEFPPISAQQAIDAIGQHLQ